MATQGIIEKAKAAYEEALISDAKKQETGAQTFVKDVVFPAVLEAAKAGKSEVEVSVPDKLLTLEAVAAIGRLIGKEGLTWRYEASRKKENALIVGGWSSSRKDKSEDLASLDILLSYFPVQTRRVYRDLLDLLQ